MFAVFAAFVPEGDASLKPIALGLAVGIAVDAFIVRMTLVPAVMALLGDTAWWFPRWLDRVLPHFDIEGEAVERELALAVLARAEHDRRGRRRGRWLVGCRRLDGEVVLFEDVASASSPAARSSDRRPARHPRVALTLAGRSTRPTDVFASPATCCPSAAWVRAHVGRRPARRHRASAARVRRPTRGTAARRRRRCRHPSMPPTATRRVPCCATPRAHCAAVAATASSRRRDLATESAALALLADAHRTDVPALRLAPPAPRPLPPPR